VFRLPKGKPAGRRFWEVPKGLSQELPPDKPLGAKPPEHFDASLNIPRPKKLILCRSSPRLIGGRFVFEPMSSETFFD